MSFQETLRREDLKPNRTVVVIDRLGFLSWPVVRRAAKLGHLVIFAQNVASIRNMRWYAAAVHNRHLRRFVRPAVHVFGRVWRGDDEAFAVTEPVFEYLKKEGRIPLKPLEDLYLNGDVKIAFKKHLLDRLTEFYQTVHLLNLLQAEGVRSIEFYPSLAWEEVADWLGKAGIPWHCPEGVRAICGVWSTFIKLESGLDRPFWLSILLSLPIVVLSGIRRVTLSSTIPEEIRLGIRVYGTDWGFRGEECRNIDWLLDGRQLHRGNTLFIIEKSISKKYLAEFLKRQYLTHDVSKLKAFRTVSRSFLFHELLGRGIRTWVRLVLSALFTPSIFLKVAVYGWLEYLRWTAFLERWRPHHWVAYNHIHFDHVFRNIRLSSVGCVTWYYVHSINDTRRFSNPSAGGKKVETEWAYLAYDNEVHWGELDAGLNRAMQGCSRNYLIWGPLWSAHIRPVSRVTASVKARLATDKVSAMVAVFDTSFGSGAPYGESGAKEFFEALAVMLEQPNWASRRLLFKPKNDLGEFHAQAAASLNRLLAHPHCLLLGADIAPGAVIAEADLTISIAFTSTTVEALGARRRAFYFDPGGRFPDSYYDRFPNLVAHDREALARLCEYWLGMSEADLEKYLNHYLAPEFGGYLDASAVPRFRSALSVS